MQAAFEGLGGEQHAEEMHRSLHRTDSILIFLDTSKCPEVHSEIHQENMLKNVAIERIVEAVFYHLFPQKQ